MSFPSGDRSLHFWEVLIAVVNCGNGAHSTSGGLVMPCVIILCALLERTMWKYDDPNAYRVVLIEAGHIGQNVMLAATLHGLSACPSAALDQTLIRKCIGSEACLTHMAVYALTLAVPGPVL